MVQRKMNCSPRILDIVIFILFQSFGGISMNQSYVNWDGNLIQLTWFPRKMPKIELVTSVHGYCFFKEKIMLVKIIHRGFNMPGGHIEENETPEQAFHREAFEEGYVKGELKYLGAIEVNHKENPHFNPNGKYPFNWLPAVLSYGYYRVSAIFAAV